MREAIGLGLGAATLAAVGGLAARRQRQRRGARMLALETADGITVSGFVTIGGIEQWIQIRGEHRGNPVMLILHGGPGWPNAVFTLPLRPWERHFTLVQWDQRGAGKTLARSGKPSSADMTFSRRAADAIELAERLCADLRTDRLVLLAESMGTLTGLPLVKQRPDLFSALVLTDLYVEMLQNEALKYRMTLERLRAAGNHRGVAALERIGPDPAAWDLRAWNANMAWAFKTNLPIPNLDRRLLLPLLLSSPLYSLREVATLLSGFRDSTARMLAEIKAFDARRLGLHFEVPFFLFQGESDVITLTGPAQAYFAEVDAPVKAQALIKNAGHFAAFTQPGVFLAELLSHVRPLAVPAAPDDSIELIGG